MTARKDSSQLKIGFWPRVEKTDTCWLWRGPAGKAGYAVSTMNGKRMTVHRISWIKANGPIPDGLQVCHRCDVRKCVRPDHLFLGTATDNMRDMYEKGRGPTGDRNGSRTKPERRATGDRNGSRTRPEKRKRGAEHHFHGKGDLVSGAKNPNARLTDAQIEDARSSYASGKENQPQIAKRLGVTQTHVSRLVRGLARVVAQTEGSR